MDRHRQTGFTLLELLISVAVISLLSAVLSEIVVTAQRSAAAEQTRSDLVAENRQLTDETTRNIQTASSVLASAVVLGTTYTTGTETLVLQLPAIDASQNLIPGVSDLLVYRKSGSNYEFIQDGGVGSVRPDTASRLYSKRMTSLTFTYFDSTGNQLASSFQNAYSVTIAPTISQTVRGLPITITLTDSATLRNK